jgi:hypothetical protein
VADANAPGPDAQVRALYEQAETQAARASEELVGSRGFGGLLGQFAENTAAVTKLSSDAMDLVLRNLAGRRPARCRTPRKPARAHRGQARAGVPTRSGHLRCHGPSAGPTTRRPTAAGIRSRRPVDGPRRTCFPRKPRSPPSAESWCQIARGLRTADGAALQTAKDPRASQTDTPVGSTGPLVAAP